MKRLFWIIPLVFLFCFTFACQKQGKEAAKEPEASVEADVAAIKASFDEWVQLSNAVDLDRIVSIFYTEDSIQMPPNESISKGKDAILLGYQRNRELNDEHWDSCTVKDVRVSGDLAIAWGIDTGTTTPRSGGEAVAFDLKWLTALERQSDGTWKWIYEIWNDNPLPEAPARQKDESAEQELIKLENEWADALVKHDWTFLERILADDYLVTDPEGNVSAKAQEIAFFKSGEFAVTSCAHHEMKVRVYGDTAVVTGHTTTKGTYKGKDFIDNVRWTDTWIKSAGQWQCVAGHSSAIAQK